MSDTSHQETKSYESSFGTFKGLFVPNVTMMFGVILFLRLNLVLGYLGIWGFLGVIAISLVVMLITSMSIASVVTNMKVGGGGAYFLISRSLGIEIGGALGFSLVLSQLISLTLVVSGFAYSFASLYPHLPIVQIEIITMIALLLLASISTNLALKTQQLIFWSLCAAILSVFFFTSSTVEPLGPGYFLGGLTFWEGFALFYPALTGIEAGMALSGNLKNPSRSLSVGNITSIIFGALVYAFLAVFLWFKFPDSVLQSSAYLLIFQSKVPYLIYMGIWLATLSSALGNLMGAPRMLQMIAEDGVIPEFLSRTFGKHREPLYATVAIFILALILLLTTTIDQIIPILTMICLLTYGSLNLVAGFEELIHSPTWRPTFKTPWQLSFFGALLCYSLMFIINPIWAGAAILLAFIIYLGLRSRGFEVSYQDLQDNIVFYLSRHALYRLSKLEDLATTWHPQVIFVSRSPMQNEMMIRVAHSMTQRSGILTVASIVPEFWSDPEQIEQLKARIKEWLDDQNIQAVAEVNAFEQFYEGIENLIKTYGIGPLQPNTLWIPSGEAFESDIDDVVSVIHQAQLNTKNLILSFCFEDEIIKRPSRGRKRIDLWWDPDHRESFELMMSYILSLRTGAMWTNRTVKLRALVPDKVAKEHLEDHFRQLFLSLRLKIRPIIEIEPEGELCEFIQKYSKKADLIFAPLKPISDFEDEGSFRAYLLNYSRRLPKSTPVLAVTSYDLLDHREVYTE